MEGPRNGGLPLGVCNAAPGRRTATSPSSVEFKSSSSCLLSPSLIKSAGERWRGIGGLWAVASLGACVGRSQVGRYLGGVRCGWRRQGQHSGRTWRLRQRNRRLEGQPVIRLAMDKLKKVLSGQDTEDRGGLSEVSASGVPPSW